VIKTKEWKYLLRTIGYPQSERAPRRNPTGLVAVRGSDLSSKLGQIKEISRTGFFLQTTERWPIGKVVSLSVQKENPAANDSELKINIPARVASQREVGVGMAFLLPEGMDKDLWEYVVDSVDTQTESKDTQSIFRMVRAMLFLYRMCASRAVEPISLLTGEQNEARKASMLEIVLAAEKLLVNEPDADELRADPTIVAGILKEGSWQRDDLIHRLWCGLLASSCSKDDNDLSNQDLIELLVEITASQARILMEACRRASAQTADNGSTKRRIIITAEEMGGVTNLYRNASEVANLHGNGLIEKNFDFSTHSTVTDLDVTPTQLGMRVFRACLGYLLESPTVLHNVYSAS
jgi:hypothetical protein